MIRYRESTIYVVLIGLLIGACTSKSDTREVDEKPQLPIIQLARHDATLDRDYAGNLEAVQNVEVRARTSGYLDKILVDEGQFVRKGQLMFQLNPAEYQVKVAEAQAALESAEAQQQSASVEMDRVSLLVNKNVISASELRLAKSKMATARATIDQAKASLAHARLLSSLTNIRAPFDGVINRLPFKRGSLIEQGALLTTISDLREVYVYFNVSEKEYLGFVKQRKDPNKVMTREVELILADDTHYPYKGKIETTEALFEDNSGTIAYRARFPNPKHLLRHGATGKVRIETDVDDAVLVPQKAVFEIQDKNYVYVLDAANTVRSRSFVPSSRVDHFYVVQSGLKPGDRIVYEGIQNVKDGMAIIPKPLPADSVQRLYADIQ